MNLENIQSLADLMKRLSEATEILKEYEQWESDLLSDNAMWWPYVAKDKISGRTYDKMLELQGRRNKFLKEKQ